MRPNEVAARLSKSRDPAETVRLLHEFAHIGGPDHATIVARFLDSRDSPFVARQALETLTSWGLATEFRSNILEFLRGVEWDTVTGGYVRLVAATAAGQILSEGPDPQLTRALLEIVEDSEADTVLRDAAYTGLLLGSGVPPDRLPSAARLHGRKSYDQTVLDRARAQS